jgi:hypothetical protein
MSIVDTPPAPAPSALGLDDTEAVTAQVLEDLQDAMSATVNDGQTEDGDDEADNETETNDDNDNDHDHRNDNDHEHDTTHENGDEGDDHDDTVASGSTAANAGGADAHGSTPRKDRGEDKENGLKSGGVRQVLKSGVFGCKWFLCYMCCASWLRALVFPSC